MSSPTTPTLLGLPNELQFHIVSYVSGHRQATLRALSATCKQMYNICETTLLKRDIAHERDGCPCFPYDPRFDSTDLDLEEEVLQRECPRHPRILMLHRAIAGGYQDKALRIIIAAIRLWPEYLNVVDADGWAPIHYAADTNDETVIRHLISPPCHSHPWCGITCRRAGCHTSHENNLCPNKALGCDPFHGVTYPWFIPNGLTFSKSKNILSARTATLGWAEHMIEPMNALHVAITAGSSEAIISLLPLFADPENTSRFSHYDMLRVTCFFKGDAALMKTLLRFWKGGLEEVVDSAFDVTMDVAVAFKDNPELIEALLDLDLAPFMDDMIPCLIRAANYGRWANVDKLIDLLEQQDLLSDIGIDNPGWSCDVAKLFESTLESDERLELNLRLLSKISTHHCTTRRKIVSVALACCEKAPETVLSMIRQVDLRNATAGGEVDLWKFTHVRMGTTIIHEAILRRADRHIIRAILERCCDDEGIYDDIDEQNVDGDWALSALLSIEGRDDELAKLLLRYGARPRCFIVRLSDYDAFDRADELRNQLFREGLIVQSNDGDESTTDDERITDDERTTDDESTTDNESADSYSEAD